MAAVGQHLLAILTEEDQDSLGIGGRILGHHKDISFGHVPLPVDVVIKRLTLVKN
jgi:hypothetical protein